MEHSNLDHSYATEFFGPASLREKNTGVSTRHGKKAGVKQTSEFPPSVLLSRNEVLTKLPADFLDRIRTAFRPVVLSKEKFLFMQDDLLEFVYFPASAVISEFKILEDGRTVEIAITGKEGAVGISSIFGSSTAAHCTQVSQAGTAFKIESEILRRHLTSHPKPRRILYEQIDSYIRQISQKAICNMYHSVEERFCTWLLMLSDRSGNETLTLTHEQIARTLGVYRPSVTCIALELRKRKLINYGRGGIAIMNRKGIEKLACACYKELDGRPSSDRHN